jgi:signal transduction histidine kinase
VSPLSRLRDRWDLDADTQVSLPFDRAIAVVNLRRIEIACLLELFNIAIEIGHGLHQPAVVLAFPAAIAFSLLSRWAVRWPSLRLQQAAVIVFVTVALGDVIWGVVQVSHGDHVSSGYLLNLLCITMLFVLPPRPFALIVVGAGLVYGAAVMRLPLSNGAKVTEILNALVVSGISQVAGWLIYSARRSDHNQKRLIRAQNAKLSQQNHERDQLMAITAHDLRSPLYGLRNLLDLASRRGTDDSALQTGAMRDAVFSLDGMIGLVSRLLDAHSAEHEPLAARVRADIRGHLLAAARRVAPASAAKGVTVTVDLPDRPVVATFDANALSRILDNLLSNAVRFSVSGTPVQMRCVIRDAAAVIEIEDAGPGFDAAGRAAMFSKFHPRAGASAGAKAGTGMGLFIASSFAERMGAELSFRPAEPTGACFSLRICGSP